MLRKVAATFALALLAVLGNYLYLPLFFGVDLIFGSIAALAALALLGVVPALVVALAAGIYTVFLWGHPYALIVSLVEVLAVWQLRRRLSHLALVDALFWLAIGMPLLLVFYRWNLGFAWMQAELVALKQSINGVLNATVASFVVMGWRMYRQARGDAAAGVSIASLLFNVFLMLALLVGLVSMVVSGRDMRGELERNMEERLKFFAQHVVHMAEHSGPSGINLDDLHLMEGMSLALVSEQGRILAAQGEMSTLSGSGALQPSSGDMQVWLPDGKMAPMQRWRRGEYVVKFPVPGTPNHILVEQDAAPTVERVEQHRLYTLALLAALTLASAVLAALLSRLLTRPLRQLDELSRDLPKRIMAGMPGTKPVASGGIAEYIGLAGSIKGMAVALGASFSELREMRDTLEQQVLARTREVAQKAQMIEQVSDAILLLDMNRNILECNAGAVKMFGYSEDEFKRLTLKQLYFPADWEKVQQFVRDELAHKDVVDITPRYVKQSGEIINAHVLVRQLRDESGKPEGVLLYITDMTARVAMEERLTLSQQIAHYGLWDWNIQTGELAWTDEIYRIFGLQPGQSEASYPAFVERIHPDDRAAVLQAVQDTVESDQPYEIEHRIVRPDGSVRDVLEKGQVYRDPDGKPLRMVGVMHDITERRALQKQLDMFRQMIESSNDPVYLMDADDGCRLTYINEAAVKHWQVPHKTLLTWRLSDWDPNFSVDKIPSLIEFARNNPGALIETEHRIGNGTMVPVSVSANLLELDHKTYIFGYFKDISERKRIERDLAQAKEQAEAANEAKSYFLANMSHEIRTPMNAIIGFSHLCLQTKLEPTQHEYLEKVYQSANSLLGIINDILDFSKIESGKLDIESEPFQLDEVLDSVATIAGMHAEESGLELIIDKGLEIPQSLEGDALRLGQVLNNLVSNAVKFTHAGEVVLQVKVESQSARQVTLRFTVSDTGIGMTEEQMGRLFQSFSQADISTTRKYGGTGLGLAVSKRLVELMGGRIWAESTPGQGSRFMFTLPFARLSDAARTEPNLGGHRMLVLEDNASARNLMLDYLKSFGIAATALPSALEGLDAIARACEQGLPFTDVLLDWSLPDMPGLEVARRIRQQLPMNSHPRILYLAGHTQNNLADETGPGKLLDALIDKPVTASRLFDGIMACGAGAVKLSSRTLQQADKHHELAGLRMLLVEDNLLNQQLAKKLLVRVGVEVTVAADGLEALQAVQQQRFDAVLMDVQMPNMDGMEATRQIRNDPAHADLPIIAMTANAMAGDRERCIEAGMNDYIAKPIHYETLYATLARWTHRVAEPEVAQAGLDQAHTAAPAQSAAADSALLAQLSRQLQAYDSEAGDTMRQLRQHTKGTADAARYAQLDRYIGAYDYENALAELQRLTGDARG